ncbi:MAG TPA: hypothetical protein VK530_03485 [Candidatus Acidoferrum sp.]|nr:hypothetical protein [Candidatus Acidoferrum sp.]
MKKEKTILLLENAEDDVFMFRRALLNLEFRGQVRVVESVREAREYMIGDGSFHDRKYFPVPDLIVCDFGLSGERGSDFVQWLKQHPAYNHIPVVFFTGSIPEKQIPAMVRQFQIPVHKKDVDFHVITNTVKTMLEYMSQNSRAEKTPSAHDPD